MRENKLKKYWKDITFVLTLFLIGSSLVIAGSKENTDYTGLLYAALLVAFIAYLMRRVRNQNMRYKVLVNHIPGVVFSCKRKSPWPMLSMSEGVLDLTGYDASVFLNHPITVYWRDLVLEEDRAILDTEVDPSSLTGYVLEYRIKTRSGDIKWVQERAHIIEEMDYIDGVIFDISKQKEFEFELIDKNDAISESYMETQALYEEMAATEETLRYQYDTLNDYHLQLEEERNRYQMILLASSESFFEYRPSEDYFSIDNRFQLKDIELKPLDDFLKRVFPDDRDRLIWFKPVQTDPLPSYHEVKARILDDLGNLRWYSLIGTVSNKDNGETFRVIGSITDIQDEMIQQEKIEHMAYHDMTTGLYNHEYLLDQVSRISLKGGDGDAYVLLVIGFIDNQRLMNTYERYAIEILNFQLSATVKYAFDGVDCISVLSRGRIAAWIALSECDADLLEKVEDICKQVSRFELLNYDLIALNIGVGAVYFTDQKLDASELLSQAEMAFEYAEAKERYNEIVWFDGTMKDSKDRVLQLEHLLQRAISEQELRLVYQPQYTGYDDVTLYGYEALIRWKSKVLGNVPPNDFIPLAEKSGLINDIGKFVIKNACQFLKRYEVMHHEKIGVSINASFKELVRKDYVSYMLEMIQTFDIAPWQLRIEITETAISEYIESVIDHLNTLKSLGFDIHMDDFGTGYSSLNQLGRLPIRVLKIDKSFVQNMEQDPKMSDITWLIIDVGHRFNMEIIAEGIERKSQWTQLQKMGCDHYQGYLLSKPIEEEDVLCSGRPLKINNLQK